MTRHCQNEAHMFHSVGVSNSKALVPRAGVQHATENELSIENDHLMSRLITPIKSYQS